MKILFIFGTRLADAVSSLDFAPTEVARVAYDWQTQADELSAFYRVPPCRKDEQIINQ